MVCKFARDAPVIHVFSRARDVAFLRQVRAVFETDMSSEEEELNEEVIEGMSMYIFFGFTRSVRC